MKILINVVNARNVGRALNVAYDFLMATQKYGREGIEWHYAVPKCLDNLYIDDEFRKKAGDKYHVFPNQPDFFRMLKTSQWKLMNLEKEINPDVIFTILGPCYDFFVHKEVVRFVHPWVVTANEFAWKTLPMHKLIRMKMRVVLMRSLLRNCKYIITPTEAVKEGLVKNLRTAPECIKVISSTLSPVFKSLDNSTLPGDEGWVDISAVGTGGRKDFVLIPEILKILRDKYGITNYRFNLTLPETSFMLPIIKLRASLYGVEKCIINHGDIQFKEIATLYRKCKVCFLPSVLEVLSLSNIEAMFFQLPTVATDLPFNDYIFGGSCLGFKPMNAESAAAQIVKAVTDETLREDLKKKMSERLASFIDYEKYFNETVDYLEEVGTSHE